MMAMQSDYTAWFALMDSNSELVTTVISPVFTGVVGTRRPTHVLGAACAKNEVCGEK
jgi:hypothetical protein